MYLNLPSFILTAFIIKFCVFLVKDLLTTSTSGNSAYNQFMKNTIQDKAKLVNSVFSKVYNKYDLMNDIMSLGIHRIWKNKFIDWMNPSRNSSLIDVASGTGDIAKLFSLRNKNSSTITCIEPNEDMLKKGEKIL